MELTIKEGHGAVSVGISFDRVMVLSGIAEGQFDSHVTVVD